MVKDRVKAYCESEKITISSFERSIGVANGYVNSISRSIGIDKLTTIVEKYPNLNLEWLLVGKGDMYKNVAPPSIPEVEGDAAVYLRLLSEKDEIIRQQAEQIGMLKAELSHRGQNVENAQSIKPAAAG